MHTTFDLIMSGVIGFLAGGFFGVLTMALMIAAHDRGDDNEI